MSVNKHETIYVVSPEINNGQMLFRDNNKGAIDGNGVVLLLATTTTGETIRRAMECILSLIHILEEIFIYEMGGEDYEVKDIIY